MDGLGSDSRMVVADSGTGFGFEMVALAGSADHPMQGSLLDRNPLVARLL